MKKGLLISMGILSGFLIRNAEINAVPYLVNRELMQQLEKKNGVEEDFFSLAVDELKKGNSEKAISTLELLAAANPNNGEYHSCIGLLYESLGKKEMAIANFRKALSIDSDIAFFCVDTAINSAREKNYERAAFYLELVSEKDVGKPVHHNLLGMLYGALDRYEESVSEFSKAIELDKLCADAYFNLGFINYIRYLETNDKSLLKDIISKFIIANELTDDEKAMNFAKKAYEILNNVRIEDNPVNIENLRWKNYDLRIRINYLRLIKNKE